jgi:4-hydroxybenzoate polyprenyltransferase
MLKHIVKLLRPKQWYKNFIVFLPLIFSGNLFNTTAALQALTAFASFCALSSATYVINDYADRKRDKLHPEKKNRPIASGAISAPLAIILAGIALLIGAILAMKLPITFGYTAAAYFILSQIYTFWLKHETFADILTIATNFVLRAVAGAYAISVAVSPWLVLGVFFLAIYLVLGKRRADLAFLSNAKAHRPSLAGYTTTLTNTFSIIATTLLVISYTLYVFFGTYNLLYITLPLALYALFRYETIITSGNKISRHPEYVVTDKRMMITIAIWGIITFAILYFLK